MAGLFACHFFGFGLFLPFIPVVLEFQGISPAEIGFVLGVGTILRIAASPLLANLSDRTGQRRLSILIYSLIGAASVALFALPGGLLVAGAAVISYMVFKAPVLPLSDAYALDVARNTGTDYARMRLWGSAGFVAANLAGGALAAQATSWIILALIALASLATGFVAMSMPPQRREEPGDEQGGETPTAPFKSVWFWPVLAVLGLFQASHAAFYGFGTLYWQAKGVPDFAIGSLWAVGVVAEIALFTIAGKTGAPVRSAGLPAGGGHCSRLPLVAVPVRGYAGRHGRAAIAACLHFRCGASGGRSPFLPGLSQANGPEPGRGCWEPPSAFRWRWASAFAGRFTMWIRTCRST
ncbi:MFS transporter [Roseibium salinum]|nr:MFS transporter [Roseibium salinum]